MEAKYSEIILYLQFYYPTHNCSCSQQENFKFSASEKCVIYFCKTQHELSVNQTTTPNDSHSICLYKTCIFKENVFNKKVSLFSRYAFVVTYKILLQTS